MELSLVQPRQIIIGLNQEAIDEWIEYRQDKKKPLSELALKKSQNFLLKFPEPQQQVMVDAAVMNDWQGLHAVDPPKQTSSRQTSIEQDLNDRSWAN